MIKSKKFWGFVLSFLFLWLALKGLDFKQIPDILKNLSWLYIPLILVSVILEHFTRGIRWKKILHGRSVTVKQSFYATVLGYFFNNIFPARAGEFIKAWYLKEKGSTDFGEAFGSVVVERFLDGVFILGLMCFSLNLFTSTPLMKNAAIITLVFYALILVFIVLTYFWKNSFEKIAVKVFSIFPAKLSEKLTNAFNSFMSGLVIITSSFSVFINSIIWTIIAWGFTFLTHYLLIRMFNLDLDFYGLSFIMVVLAIGSMIPGSPGNVGIYEYSCVIALKMLGFSNELGAAFGLLTHTLNYVIIAIEGFVVLTIENLSIKEIQEGQEKASNNVEAEYIV